MVLLVIFVAIIVVPIAVAIMTLVPLVIMVKPAAVPFPVARIKLLAIVTRSYPSSALIGWPRPVTVMPLVTISLRVPIAVQPDKIRAWAARSTVNHAGLRRRADSNSK